MSKEAADRLASLLQLADLFEPLNVDGEDNYVVLFGRVRKERRDRWEKFLTSLLKWTNENQICRVHACQRYLLKNDRLAYGWNLSLEIEEGKTTSVMRYLHQLLEVYDPGPMSKTDPVPTEAPRSDAVPMRRVSQQVLPSGEVITIETDPLPGVFKERVPNENGKGGYLIGSHDRSKNFRPPSRR